MNPSQCTQPQQLFGASIHAGGWPKLGWTQQDVAEDSFDDERIEALDEWQSRLPG